MRAYALVQSIFLRKESGHRIRKGTKNVKTLKDNRREKNINKVELQTIKKNIDIQE